VHRRLGNDPRALEALEKAYEQNLLVKGPDLELLARMYAAVGRRDRAERVLLRALEAGAIAADSDVWKILRHG
jgi:tetratricopeptide (TPR) repeat protein